MKKSETIIYGSGNVFADLGFPNPEEHLAKAMLVTQIADIMKKRGLTQAAAAKILGIDQPKVSDMLRGRFRGFSLGRLMHFLNLLGCDVEIIVKNKPRNRRQGETHVVV